MMPARFAVKIDDVGLAKPMGSEKNAGASPHCRPECFDHTTPVNETADCRGFVVTMAEIISLQKAETMAPDVLARPHIVFDACWGNDFETRD